MRSRAFVSFCTTGARPDSIISRCCRLGKRSSTWNGNGKHCRCRSLYGFFVSCSTRNGQLFVKKIVTLEFGKIGSNWLILTIAMFPISIVRLGSMQEETIPIYTLLGPHLLLKSWKVRNSKLSLEHD